MFLINLAIYKLSGIELIQSLFKPTNRILFTLTRFLLVARAQNDSTWAAR